MESPFQCTTLVSAPCYPNSIVWSDENLIAVASGRHVTILNPASVLAPKGTIGIAPGMPLPIGVVMREHLMASCLLPIIASRDDNQPFVRSIAWSPLGLAPNSGCLLSVCDTDGRVRVYMQPIYEYSSEWAEVADISKLLYEYHLSAGFRECKNSSSNYFGESVSSKEGISGSEKSSGLMKSGESIGGKNGAISKSFAVYSELVDAQFSTVVEVLKEENGQRAWMVGTIKSFKKSKVLVAFSETNEIGEHCEWFDLCAESAQIEHMVDGNKAIVSYQSKVRPFTKLGCLPKEILYVHGLKKVLKTGQLVEVWNESRWVEGSFMHLNDRGLMVKLSGCHRGKTMNPVNVRLAPVWNGKKELWQFTLLKVATENQESYDISHDDNNTSTSPGSLTSSMEGKLLAERKFDGGSLTITSKQYACRHQMLASLVVAWSPILLPSVECGYNSKSSCSERCAILAIGGKSGKISLWRVYGPQHYTIECDIGSIAPLLIGSLQASNAWVSVIGWEVCVLDASNPQFILAMGSTDGSVRIWSVGLEELRTSSDVIPCFSLLKELKIPVPVSTISLVVPVKSSDKIQVAVGGGSGSVEVWICNISCNSYSCIGHFDAHHQVVTGLSWASDGCCLYSSAQDNSLCCWAFCGTILKEIVFPSAGHSGRTHNNLPLMFDSCFGLTLSPGNLAVAVVHSCNVDLLDPMYQARTQKAAVAYSWTGGLSLHIQPEKTYGCEDRANPVVDVQLWESNVVKSLQQREDVTKPLVLWDTVAALRSLYIHVPDIVESLVVKWFMSWLGDCPNGLSIDNILLLSPRLLKKGRTRCLHLLNIVCRRVLMIVNSKRVDIWTELLYASEKELRERLVALHFYAFLNDVSPLPKVLIPRRDWVPFGVGLMKQWVDSVKGSDSDRLVLLAKKVATNKRTQSACDFVTEEKCGFCASTVPFESPEFGICRGEKCGNSGSPCHKLNRCAVSMQICSLSPSWFCVCCQRSISNFAPWSFFTLSESSDKFSLETEIGSVLDILKPLCPFCGILLQKRLPEFLLSPSPV